MSSEREKLAQEVLRLREEGLSYREIANKLGISLGKAWRLANENASSRNIIRDFKEEVEALKAALEELLPKFQALEWTASLRVNFSTQWVCSFLDEEGYCTYWKMPEDPGYIGSKEVDGIYLMHVVDVPFICLGCPAYTPSGAK